MMDEEDLRYMLKSFEEYIRTFYKALVEAVYYQGKIDNETYRLLQQYEPRKLDIQLNEKEISIIAYFNEESELEKIIFSIDKKRDVIGIEYEKRKSGLLDLLKEILKE